MDNSNPASLPVGTIPGTVPNGSNVFSSGCLAFLGALIIAGTVGEILYRINPTAGILFALLIIMGYAAAGHNLQNVQSFLNKVTGVTS